MTASTRRLPTLVSPTLLRELGSTFFASRVTGERWRGYIPLEDLGASVLHQRRLNLSTLSALPGSAFRVTTSVEGVDRWTAGQVVDHIVTVQRQVSLPVIRALSVTGCDFIQPVDPIAPMSLCRDDAIDVLVLATEELDLSLADVPWDDPCDCIVEHRFFGTLDLRAALLLLALHELDHGDQLQAMTNRAIAN